MCAGEHPSAKAVIDNLKKPMPFLKKIVLVMRNSTLKILKLQSCCGHPGEPGC